MEIKGEEVIQEINFEKRSGKEQITSKNIIEKMDTEKAEVIAETLRGLNLKLTAVKEASTKLLPYTSEENAEMFVRVWEQVFHEKRNSERERIGLFFVVHELFYRSNNKRF